jgi:hypothetical protein
MTGIYSRLISLFWHIFALSTNLTSRLSTTAIQFRPQQLWLRNHDLPHPYAAVEGLYTKIQLPDFSTLVIILVEVRGVEALVHVSRTPGFKYDIITHKMNMLDSGIVVDDIGYLNYTPSVQSFDLSLPEELQVQVKLTDPLPWNSAEGFISEFGPLIPIHWHVMSLRSTAHVVLMQKGFTILDTYGIAHMEKNWGDSFPKGWIWSQGSSATTNTTLALAGGMTMGIEAYLLGYRSPKLSWDFRPPWTVRAGGISAGLVAERSWKYGAFNITVNDVTRKLEVAVVAPKGTFLTLTCPLKDGFVPEYAHESFQAKMTIRAYRRSFPWSSWNLIEVTTIEHATLEFGGSYYQDELKKERVD